VDNILEPVRLSTHATHSAPQMKVSNEGMVVTTDKVYKNDLAVSSVNF
jgi:hypothetical protein